MLTCLAMLRIILPRAPCAHRSEEEEEAGHACSHAQDSPAAGMTRAGQRRRRTARPATPTSGGWCWTR